MGVIRTLANIGASTVCLASLCAGPATAQGSLPKFDPVANCDVASAFSGGSESVKRSCLDMEQSAYDELKTAWAGAPAKAKEYCEKFARSGGKGSYSLLRSCLDMEIKSADQNKDTQFKW